MKMNMNLDELIAHLTKLRTDGTPGTTPVVVNHRYGGLNRIQESRIQMMRASKTDMASGNRHVEGVSRQGVEVLTLD